MDEIIKEMETNPKWQRYQDQWGEAWLVWLKQEERGHLSLTKDGLVITPNGKEVTPAQWFWGILRNTKKFQILNKRKESTKLIIDTDITEAIALAMIQPHFDLNQASMEAEDLIRQNSDTLTAWVWRMYTTTDLKLTEIGDLIGLNRQTISKKWNQAKDIIGLENQVARKYLRKKYD